MENLPAFLMRSAAIQAGVNQFAWDGLVIIFFGDPFKDPITLERISVLLFQIKNMKRTCRVRGDASVIGLPTDSDLPIVSINMLLGAIPKDGTRVAVNSKDKP